MSGISIGKSSFESNFINYWKALNIKLSQGVIVASFTMEGLRLFNSFLPQKADVGNGNSATSSANMSSEKNFPKNFSSEIREVHESLQKVTLNGETTDVTEEPINLKCEVQKDSLKFARVDYIQPATEPQSGRDTRHTNQTAYLYAEVIEKLWEHECAWIFAEPVNATAWGIPDYYEKIRDPIDLGTIRKRLLNKYYYNGDECIHDIRKMFNNCYDYNGPDHDLVPKAQAFQEEFEKKFQAMPKVEYEVESIGPIRRRANLGCHKKRRTSYFVHPKKKLAPTTHYRKEKCFSITQMRRDTDSKTRNVKKDSEESIDLRMDRTQLDHCASILNEMLSEKHASYAWPFYQDDKSTILGIVEYKDIIENPVDLTTIRTKIESKIYSNHEEFAADMRIMISNFNRFQTFANYVSITLAKKFQSEFEILYRKFFPYQLGIYSFDWYMNGSDGGVQLPFNAAKDIEKFTQNIDGFIKRKKRKAPEQNCAIFFPKKKKYKKKVKSVCPEVASTTIQGTEIASTTMETENSTLVEHSVQTEEKASSDSDPEKDIAFDYMTEYNERRLLSLDIHKLQDVDLVNVLKVVPKEEQVVDKNGGVTLDLEKMCSQTVQRLKRYVKNCIYPERPKLKNLPGIEALALKSQWLESKLRCIDAKLALEEDVKIKKTKDENMEMLPNVEALKNVKDNKNISGMSTESDSDSEASMSDSSSSDSTYEGIDQNETNFPETD